MSIVFALTNNEDPYRKNSQYQRVNRERNIQHEGVSHTKYTYEKKYSLITRLGLGVLVFFSYVFIVPTFLYSDKVRNWKKGALEGLSGEQKVVMVVRAKAVGFYQVRAREFDRLQSPDTVASQVSQVLGVLTSSALD